MKNLLFIAFLVPPFLYGQTIDIEKTYEVSKEAQKGFIHSVETDDAAQQINFTYRVRSKKDQLKFINYTFDYNFNMVKESEELIELEKLKDNKRYKPKKYRGENYEVEGLYIEPNMMGTLVVKRKVTKFSWNWFQMQYNLNTSVEGKLKAKTDDDKKLFYFDHIEDANSGTAMILAGEKGPVKDGAYNHMMNFHFLKYDINLTKLADVTVNFEYPQAVVATYSLPQEEDDTKTDFIAIFATFKEKRYMGPKIWGNDPTEYTYVRVSYEGKQLDRATFNVPNTIWRIDEFTFGPEGEVFFFGPSEDSKDEYYHNKLDYAEDKKKWPRFQLAKFHQGKVQFITSTSIDDFKAKLKAQPDGKKGDSYSGRRIRFTGAGVNPVTKEIIMAGQNYSPVRNSKGQIEGNGYEDIVLFHFDSKGNLQSQFTMNKKDRSLTPNTQNFEYSSDGKTLYWSFFDVVKTKAVRELDLIVEKPLAVPKMAKINLASGSFDQYTEYGNDDNFVHYAVLNYFKLTNTNQVCFLGENKKGSALWFVRVNFDK